MKVAVRYFSKTGNTKKLANAVAEVAGVEAKSIDTPLEEDVDILFLGNSVYAIGVAKEVKSFISSIDKTVGNIVNFSTAAFLAGTYKPIKKLVEAKCLIMSDKEFHCKGQFHAANKNRPNEQDIADIKEFTKKVLAN